MVDQRCRQLAVGCGGHPASIRTAFHPVQNCQLSGECRIRGVDNPPDQDPALIGTGSAGRPRASRVGRDARPVGPGQLLGVMWSIARDGQRSRAVRTIRERSGRGAETRFPRSPGIADGIVQDARHQLAGVPPLAQPPLEVTGDRQPREEAHLDARGRQLVAPTQELPGELIALTAQGAVGEVSVGDCRSLRIDFVVQSADREDLRAVRRAARYDRDRVEDGRPRQESPGGALMGRPVPKRADRSFQAR